ncbi:tripartite tricarboxylate transporter substrate-binding protein [Neptunomonas phycophila]|uniref:Tripartite tricarboxylate transporter substrate-binding protein n=1 Tax=Neptunomonas phycophila TaxID=1572645 RepID=A0AAW7XDS2_9GAMM|nr:tripartite tricarboxylate transporter substrate-binding protein [Neptunomonas phycophila]MBT3146786.1 tripartite tricarboxylate transporter substrate binding protein [Neptunomonas phycophila]MDO6452576.1 tripartite tricarboxylate transporter substrate-binding protein [Neptunomonas phycophila]MDO6467770.1 tripartite tricarboxylate transporter substrate-binding protein [Neptunomonas phycophila]MDO6783761.1 tripartite tricarboxylate transporter substrate-binding protein [Neptunomonas phycophila
MLSKFFSRNRSTLLAAALVSTLGAGTVQAEVDEIHFLIPGGAGGGWDGTARGVGEALTKSGLVESASYENLSGGGGGKAIAHLIEMADQSHNTLMVNSTPIVIRSLSKVFPQSFRDLTPIAAVVGDYGAFVVPTDSKYKSFTDVVKDYSENPRSVAIAGGSARGSMDHLVAAMAFKAAGGDARKLKYVAYDAGGKAMAGILSGEAHLLSTGFSEALALAEAGEVRILAITGDERSATAPDVPTLKELGYDATFVNWRGFFGAPGLPDAEADEYAATLGKMYETGEWEVVRDRNGWTEIFKPRAEFVAFLENQEEVVGNLMRELGFLK